LFSGVAIRGPEPGANYFCTLPTKTADFEMKNIGIKPQKKYKCRTFAITVLLLFSGSNLTQYQ